jgi:hypothetical protein
MLQCALSCATLASGAKERLANQRGERTQDSPSAIGSYPFSEPLRDETACSE